MKKNTENVIEKKRELLSQKLGRGREDERVKSEFTLAWMENSFSISSDPPFMFWQSNITIFPAGSLVLIRHRLSEDTNSMSRIEPPIDAMEEQALPDILFSSKSAESFQYAMTLSIPIVKNRMFCSNGALE